MTLLESKECIFKKRGMLFSLSFPFILLASYEPPGPVYTDFQILVHRICGYISTESELKLVERAHSLL